jgi:hypothetical protein
MRAMDVVTSQVITSIGTRRRKAVVRPLSGRGIAKPNTGDLAVTNPSAGRILFGPWAAAGREPARDVDGHDRSIRDRRLGGTENTRIFKIGCGG